MREFYESDSNHSEYKTLHSGHEDEMNRHTTVRTSLIEPSWPKARGHRNVESQSANSHR